MLMPKAFAVVCPPPVKRPAPTVSPAHMKVYAIVFPSVTADLSAMLLTPLDVHACPTAVPLVLDTLAVKTASLEHFKVSSTVGENVWSEPARVSMVIGLGNKMCEASWHAAVIFERSP
jgi:hypothetical protein